MPSRRNFLSAVGIAAIGGAIPGRSALDALLGNFPSTSDDPLEAAGDEEFWARIADTFLVDRSFINLNNGGVSPTGEPALKLMFNQLRYAQGLPSRRMWNEQAKKLDVIRERLASHWGVDGEEVALTRNASEGLHICQNAMDLVAGDEVVTSTMDYPRMINAWKQREQRDGIVLKQVKIPVPCESAAEFLKAFAAAMTPRTKVLHICHVINLNGQILPVRELCDMAHRHGAKVIVDGAHGLAHFPFKISELGCDFYATSLHKWLAAPIGTGLLWMRREHIPSTWPLMAGAPEQVNDIRKFEEIGTNPVALKLGIAPALDLHQRIGDERKAARLRFLRDRWINATADISGFSLRTSIDPRWSCGFATLDLAGITPGTVFSRLLNQYRILVAPINHSETMGIRVSPSVYTTTAEIDRFCDALKQIARDER